MGLGFRSWVRVSSAADKNRTLLLSISASSGPGSSESDRGKSEPGIVMEGFFRSWGYAASAEIGCVGWRGGGGFASDED